MTRVTLRTVVPTVLGTCLALVLLAYAFYIIRKADRITRDITNRVNRERWDILAEANQIRKERTE